LYHYGNIVYLEESRPGMAVSSPEFAFCGKRLRTVSTVFDQDLLKALHDREIKVILVTPGGHVSGYCPAQARIDRGPRKR
jgi:hypothetical protein